VLAPWLTFGDFLGQLDSLGNLVVCGLDGALYSSVGVGANLVSLPSTEVDKDLRLFTNIKLLL
jgi:hypothetical protein